MCGIAGYLLNELPDNLDLLHEKIIHRGRDDSGIFKTNLKDGYLGLFHRRLSIYDLSKNATQPKVTSDSSKIFIFNGAIYNFKELWKLIGGDISYKPKGDTEVLAEALSKWDSIKTWMQCNGMFSIAIFDKEHESLKIARDRAGQKPLFYVLNPIIKGKRYKGIIFASEIKAILPIIDTTIDKKFIYEYLILGRVESSINTLYKDIKRLKPGNEMFYNLDQKEPVYNSFWNIYDKAQQIISNESILEINQKCKAYIEDSVNMQITGDRKLGIMLSSGVDSTVIASLMRKYSNQKIFSFTYDFKNSDLGESSISKQTSDVLELDYIDSEGIDTNYIKENLVEVIRHQDEPITSIRTIAQHYIHEIASSVDCRIIIEGNGGDEIFGGYEYYNFARLLDIIQDPNVNTKNINPKNNDENLIVGLRSILLQGICSKDGTESRNLDNLQDWLRESSFNLEFGTLNERVNHIFGWRINSQLNDFLSTLLPRSLRYVDRASMASGNEARAPLLDHNVVEYGIASSMLNYAKDERRALLRSMGNLKALNIAGSHKKTIVDPQRDWLYGELFSWGIELIMNSKEKLKEYYKFDNLLKNLNKEKVKWANLKQGNSGAFMQAINLAVLLNP
tara:strand:+ start:991 stop:2850 length:1860 start_codon:yes stop_codon:yes gene_type:complete